MKKLAWAGLLVLSGCYFLTSFDPEGQPCDPTALRQETQCLSDAGYWCVKGSCQKGTGPANDGGSEVDGGVDAGSDSGTDAGFDAGVDAGTDAGKVDGGADAGKFDGGCDGGKLPDGGKFDGGC